MDQPVNVFWFRRDLRLSDNRGLFEALSAGKPVLLLFVFDRTILDKLANKNDSRVSFIHGLLERMNNQLNNLNTSILVRHSTPLEVFEELLSTYQIESVYTNKDYEPYAIQRDQKVRNLLAEAGVGFESFKDQVIFEQDEVVKDDGKPYTVYTPYSTKWLANLKDDSFAEWKSQDLLHNVVREFFPMPTLHEIGFELSDIAVENFRTETELVERYEDRRNTPSVEGTTKLSPHFRFGSISIREACRRVQGKSHTLLKEFIWREFFMQILWHFPQVVDQSFKIKYDRIPWVNNEDDFEKWKFGKTGVPLVDAGMRELINTGFMHNRVRMVVASFLVKNLLIDWRWGEAWFAEHLLDFDLAQNNGNWQWAAGTGCDAAPYFRVFNPVSQQEKFDPQFKYIKKWVPEWGSGNYPKPMVDLKESRVRAIETYKNAIQ